MITLVIALNFKGTKKEYFQTLILAIAFDSCYIIPCIIDYIN